MMRSGSSNGRLRSSTALTRVKTALVAPMPRASAATAARVKRRSLTSRRAANRRSCRMLLIGAPQLAYFAGVRQRFRTCDAAPSAVSQSPNPQSHEAFASDGCAVTSSLTRARSLCETPKSRARDAVLARKGLVTPWGVDGGAGHTGPACCSCCASARAVAKENMPSVGTTLKN